MSDQIQFSAGYIVDAVAEIITEKKLSLNKLLEKDLEELNQINGLLQHVTSFDVEFPKPYRIDHSTIHPLLATVNNIICRGLPTRAPILLEQIFEKIGLTKADQSEFEINYKHPLSELNYNNVFVLLHIIEPGLTIDNSTYDGKPGSKLESRFINSHPFLIQILQSQRSFDTINKKLNGERSVDFCFTSPYWHWNSAKKRHENIGTVIEINGPHHKSAKYVYYDEYREALAKDENFCTEKITNEDIFDDNIDFEKLIDDTIYKIFDKNYHNSIDKNLDHYSLIFIPLAVARIQKCLIEVLVTQPELFQQEHINIAVIERDFPCGAIAIKSIEEHFTNINALLTNKQKYKLPEFKLTIFENKKYVLDKDLHLNATLSNEKDFKKDAYDVIFDHSILRRSNIVKETKLNSDKSIKIRSSHYFENSIISARRVYCANLLRYNSLVSKNNDGTYSNKEQYIEHIKFFLQTIFRKKEFRDGQLPIISRALQQKPVIGLLPTGGGKSITFQLPAFLQPGLCLIVDPIKSLMEDQVRVLNQNWIDFCDFINSNINREGRVKKLFEFRDGRTMFLFASPERFIIQDFRNILKNIDKTEFSLAFSYVVIDEVHCVSEWGHDFRTSYLMLGKNAQKFAQTKSKSEVTLIGLTATASFDVLTDIERELSISSNEINDAIISIDNTIRPELFFSISTLDIKFNRFPQHSYALKSSIGKGKQNLIIESINTIIDQLNSINEEVLDASLEQHFNNFELNFDFDNPEHKILFQKTKERILNINTFNDFNEVVSIIFCPHKTGSYGITAEVSQSTSSNEIFEKLKIEQNNKGYFMGGDDNIPNNTQNKIQQHFNDFITNKINYMVCTKAFGMGIDKDNIRCIHHINYSSSPESYIQEAGRAGRDRKKSICTIYIDRNFYFTLDKSIILNKIVHISNIENRKAIRSVFEHYENVNNSFSEKYYANEEVIKSKLKEIELNLPIESKDFIAFNQDKDIHSFFHSNSFKGITTETKQINRFVNFKDGIRSNRYKLLQDLYNNEFQQEVELNLKTQEDQYQGDLWLNDNKIAFGKIYTTLANPDFEKDRIGGTGKLDVYRTNEIYDFLLKKWDENKSNFASFYLFLKDEINESLNNGYSLIETFETSNGSSFTYYFPANFNPTNFEQLINSDLNLLQLNGYKSNEEILHSVKSYSINFEDFVLRIEEMWSIDLRSNPILNSKKAEYKTLYYSEIGKADVARIIYRLFSVGLIEDYTIDYNLGLYTCVINKKDKEYYIKNTENHLLKYLSRASTLTKIGKIRVETKKMSVFDTILRCVREIIEFTYKDIVEKRKTASDDLFKFITESEDRAKEHENSFTFKNYWFNYYFKDEMYYYFNAKYARSGFKFKDEPYSLIDDTDKGSVSNFEHFVKYAKVLNDQSSFISECKMMRGSCRRIWRTLSPEDEVKEYTLKLLASFATFGLNSIYYFQEASDLFIKGFSNLYNQKNDYEFFKSSLESYELLLEACTRNKDYKPYFNTAKHSIMLQVYLKHTNQLIKELNN